MCLASRASRKWACTTQKTVHCSCTPSWIGIMQLYNTLYVRMHWRQSEQAEAAQDRLSPESPWKTAHPTLSGCLLQVLARSPIITVKFVSNFMIKAVRKPKLSATLVRQFYRAQLSSAADKIVKMQLLSLSQLWNAPNWKSIASVHSLSHKVWDGFQFTQYVLISAYNGRKR